eukprot:10279241-Alexandrium_andersonii.AAC.1
MVVWPRSSWSPSRPRCSPALACACSAGSCSLARAASSSRARRSGDASVGRFVRLDVGCPLLDFGRLQCEHTSVAQRMH